MSKTLPSLISFDPILKQRIWGGTKLKDTYNKVGNIDKIGESWEISAVRGEASIVAKGVLAGTDLNKLVATYKETLVGVKNYERFGTKFPLLFKFIDAKTDLSVQLHPDDTIAKEQHDSFGKTEMWYVMQADPGAKIVVGFNQPMNKEQYQQKIASKTIESVLNYKEVKHGDTVFVYPGLIHAIGAGVVIAEIQQTSDITYRVYDYDRKDANGNLRELHQELALAAIDFGTERPYMVDYTATTNTNVPLVSCDYFITNVLEINKELSISHKGLDSFVIYMCVAGNAEITVGLDKETIACGQTLMVPASVESIMISALSAKLLQVYI